MSVPMIDVETTPGSLTAWTHDDALNGDENLRVGQPVVLRDVDDALYPAVVTGQDSGGYWYFAFRRRP